MDGFINLLKPPNMTSSDAVLAVRRLLPRGTRVGHGGTLDPDAAGVLPICVGKAARLFDYIVDKEKRYLAEATFGASTDTQDSTGRVTGSSDARPTEEEILRALGGLTGEILQKPPMFSALKRGGKKLCDLARRGEEADVEPRRVTVNALDYLGVCGYNQYMLRVSCRKGVYVRTLVNDLGERLGCLAHLSFLLRERAGAFDIRDSVTIERLIGEGPDRFCLPMDFPLQHLPALRLDGRYEKAARNGNRLPAEGIEPNAILRVYCGDLFVGIGEGLSEGGVAFRAMLL